ncbi:hypothetical protein [Clavibacter michiganensis]|uniref:Uncharacterized protein n=1 Tax=Clavibacter michiganensis subsp. insidiosus TaxID=33014 RepID=A0A0D5CI25_9MICO|nr:hypothetical protein [Clavibacter michiganensis]AJW78917.1 hypothetical protein VO01_07045 [Clavibacter michiganensis subsp. insidiosus]AWF98405.1 hypothetical protein BEH61_07795 [Clavibacter michiganensis subsp. insidiosus]AWG01394.1 hypothetical protein BEH62_07280 [Clavibacter michiganensis subsp. insidiosus]OQJ60069.1 hypothetical protein B5P21_09200 [Clavibacter michiganensis subsp. insidiosus]RII88400.1 hypothetical protein DZF92_03245 [Clavibacter michiganensis subsp. insidiosus]
MSAAPATGALPVAASPFTMLGASDAAACEGDACLVPGASTADTAAADDASAAADLARVRDAIDAGRAI